MIDAAEFPLVANAVTAGEWDFDAAFEFGLEIIIAGLVGHSGSHRLRNGCEGHEGAVRATAQ
jgi:hypothetical protein